MAKNKLDSSSIKNAKNDFGERTKGMNRSLLTLSEELINETVKTGEAWQKLIKKAITNSEPLMKKQSDILYETVKGMKSEAQYGFKRFEKLTGVDFSEIKKIAESKIPTPPSWMKDGFNYITDQTEEILTEVSKKGDEFVESVSDTARGLVKEAEDLKDSASAKMKEVIHDVESRISDISPKASAAAGEVKEAIKTSTKVVESAAEVAKEAKSTKTTTAKATKSKKALKNTTAKAQGSAKKKAKTIKATAGKGLAGVDDLKVIEGIGPKLEQIFHAAGVTTYTNLAKTEVSELQTILDNAGSKFKRYNPTSFPLQARFARDGKFEALKSWQEKNDAQKA